MPNPNPNLYLKPQFFTTFAQTIRCTRPVIIVLQTTSNFKDARRKWFERLIAPIGRCLNWLVTDVYSQQVAATDKCTRQLSAAMENASSTSSGVWNNATTLDDDLKLYQAHIRDVALKVTYIIIGTVGVLDNLFILAVFILFIKITDKVTATANIKNINRRISAMFMSPNRLPDVCKIRILCPFSLRINVMKRGTVSYFFRIYPSSLTCCCMQY